MRNKLIVAALISASACSLVGCNDDPPIVIIVPPSETPKSRIDQYFYAQFQWGKAAFKDTITMEVPDDTSSLTKDDKWDLLTDFYNVPSEIKNEPILDTAEADIADYLYRVGWHYAPSTSFFTRKSFLVYDQESPAPEDITGAYKNIFTISFPWKRELENLAVDTLPFWDIQDYMSNPSIHVGDIKWGRVGNNIFSDSLWNNDAYTGVVVSYVDSSGTLWSTDLPPTWQDGSPPSYFQIKKLYRNDKDLESYYIMEVEFTARLYNKSGAQRLAAGGRARMKILTTDIELGPQPE